MLLDKVFLVIVRFKADNNDMIGTCHIRIC